MNWFRWSSICCGVGGVGALLLVLSPWVALPVCLLLVGCSGGSIAIGKLCAYVWQVQRQHWRLTQALCGFGGAWWNWDCQTDRLFFAVPESTEHFLEPSPCSFKQWLSRIHPEDVLKFQGTLEQLLQGQSDPFEQEYRLLYTEGSYRWMLCRGMAIRNSQGQVVRLVGGQIDITSRKTTEAQLRLSGYCDRLTGLPNRAGFVEHVQQVIDRAQQSPITAFAVLWLDLDRFKVINTSLGSQLGDRLLVAVSQRLTTFLSFDDLTARLGGDEFAVLLNPIEDVNQATRTAQRIQQILALPFYLDGHEIFISVSIGIALGGTHCTHPEHLLRDADTAMHRAKARGQAKCEVFDRTMHTHVLMRLQLETDLRRAIAQQQRELESLGLPPELQVYYQPIVRLRDRWIVGFEALVRWQHPEQNLLLPGRFIPMAEETGLVVPLGWWVLREACRQLYRWQTNLSSAAALTLSVNLSSQQFSQPGLPLQIQQILEETNLSAANLKIEMTESTVMENAASVVEMLHQLRLLGVQLAIDDFGTGYSSLSYLPRFPINTLKIDRSFVMQIGANSDSLEIVRTILALAHNLGMDVTAEGVETSDQAQRLQALRCEYGQGYLFSKPVNAETATQLLLAQRSALQD